jgi:microcystin-dependent protein
MSDPFIGEIRISALNFAPYGWAFCDGRTMSIQQNTALYSLLGTLYGGDGKTTFGLPDLRGRVPIHWGNGPSLTPRTIGKTGGEQTVTLGQVPPHTHTALGAGGSGPTSPTGATWGNQPGRGGTSTYSDAIPNTPMNPQALGVSGGGAPHNNMQPYLVLNFVIALMGIYPTRE